MLVLLPTATNRLKLRWTGPYKVIRKGSPVNYEVEMPGRKHEKKVYHVNVMKQWHTMECHPQETLLATSSGLQDNAGELLSAENEGPSEEWVRVYAEHFFPTEGSGSQDIVLDVSEPQRTQLQQILSSHPGVLAKAPSITTVAQHFINVVDAAPVEQWPYHVTYSQRELVKQELDRML